MLFVLFFLACVAARMKSTFGYCMNNLSGECISLLL